jgi:hypothetical protein
MGQKIDRLGLRGTTRSRQGESKTSRKRCMKWRTTNGVHVVLWIGLTFRLLGVASIRK